MSKALLDTAMKHPKKPQAVSIAPGAVAVPEAIAQLLQYREDSLTAQLGGSMARAMKGAGPSGNYTCNCWLPPLPSPPVHGAMHGTVHAMCHLCIELCMAHCMHCYTCLKCTSCTQEISFVPCQNRKTWSSYGSMRTNQK